MKTYLGHPPAQNKGKREPVSACCRRTASSEGDEQQQAGSAKASEQLRLESERRHQDQRKGEH